MPEPRRLLDCWRSHVKFSGSGSGKDSFMEGDSTFNDFSICTSLPYLKKSDAFTVMLSVKGYGSTDCARGGAWGTTSKTPMRSRGCLPLRSCPGVFGRDAFLLCVMTSYVSLRSRFLVGDSSKASILQLSSSDSCSSSSCASSCFTGWPLWSWWSWWW